LVLDRGKYCILVQLQVIADENFIGKFNLILTTHSKHPIKIVNTPRNQIPEKFMNRAYKNCTKKYGELIPLTRLKPEMENLEKLKLYQFFRKEDGVYM